MPSVMFPGRDDTPAPTKAEYKAVLDALAHHNPVRYKDSTRYVMMLNYSNAVGDENVRRMRELMAKAERELKKERERR